ncbi:MAG: hypothetical protein ACM3N4_09520 [Nitrososphaerota archaeon]
MPDATRSSTEQSVAVNAGLPRRGRKPRSRVWITLSVIGLLAIVLVVAGGAWFMTVGGPLIASDQYYGSIRHQDYATAYASLGSDMRAGLSKEAFIQAAQQQDATAGKVSKLSYGTVNAGDPATASITVTRANGVTYTVHLKLRQESGTWKVISFDRI